MATKLTIIALRLITALFFLRVFITGVLDMSMFLLVISAGIAILFWKMPKLIKA